MVRGKTFIVLIILFCACVYLAPAEASITRDMGMGLHRVPWMVDGSESMIYLNSAYLARNSNRIFYNRIGIDDNGSNLGGLMWNPVLDLHIGVFTGLGTNYSLWNTKEAGSFFHVGDNLGTYEPKAEDNATLFDNNKTMKLRDPSGGDGLRQVVDRKDISVMLAYDLGTMAVGLSFAYASSWVTNKFDTATRNYDYTFNNGEYDIGAGYFLNLGNTMILDVDAVYTMYTMKNTYEADDGGLLTKMQYESTGAMDVRAGVGFNMNISTLQRLHFRGGYTYMNRSTKGYKGTAVLPLQNASDTYKRIGHKAEFGISDEFRFSNRVMAFLGGYVNYTMFAYNYTGVDRNNPANDPGKLKTDYKIIEVPLVIGLEGALNDYITFRFGLTQIIYDTSLTSGDWASKDGTTTAKISGNENRSNTTEFNLGLTCKAGNFRFDWVLNVAVLVEGPSFLSGKSASIVGQSSTPLSTSFAITYLFDSVVSKKEK